MTDKKCIDCMLYMTCGCGNFDTSEDDDICEMYVGSDGVGAMRVKKLYKDSIIPTRGTKEAAGLDLYAHFEDGQKDIVIYPGETVMIWSGVSLEIPKGNFGGVYARSGLSTKQGLRPANCTGVIDSDYRGEVGIPIHNDSQLWQKIKSGDRLAQLIIQPYTHVELVEAQDLSKTTRGVNGFGSTGTR